MTERIVEKSSTSAAVKFNTCSPRLVRWNIVPRLDDSLVISPAAHRLAMRVRIFPWLMPSSSASPSTLPVALLRFVVVFICALCDWFAFGARGGNRTRVRLSLLFFGRPPLYH